MDIKIKSTMGKKVNFITDITDSKEINEIKKIAEMLNPDEKVLVVARQSRFRPGGSQFTPNVIYATDRRIILRDPSMLGLKQEIIDIPYNVITNVKLDKGVFSSTVVFNAPGLFNPNMIGKIPWIRRLDTDEHGENGVIDAIPNKKAEDIFEVIRNGITQSRATTSFRGVESPSTTGVNSSSNINSINSRATNKSEQRSIADELTKLSKLKDEGVISEDEFNKMKKKLIEDH